MRQCHWLYAGCLCAGIKELFANWTSTSSQPHRQPEDNRIKEEEEEEEKKKKKEKDELP